MGKKNGRSAATSGSICRALVMWARQEECQELRMVIKHMSERKGELLVLMERKKSLLKEASGDFRMQIFQDVRELDERLSKEETELLEKNRIWKK